MKNVDVYSDEEFERLKQSYAKMNNSFERTLIFHVGTGAGLYSELGGMLEAMMWCYVNQVKFTLYADDATFADKKGWNEFFDEFCELNHNPLNKRGNYRFKGQMIKIKGILPFPVILPAIFSVFLRMTEKFRGGAIVKLLLTQDVFSKSISNEFKLETHVKWDDFGIDGTVWPEYAKLKKFALRYNSETLKEINKKIQSLNLPENYTSVQIRGGDKIIEHEKLIDVHEILDSIDKWELPIKNLFIFTDDYRKVEAVKKARPSWNIYTLCREDEKGYYVDAFNKSEWSRRREDIVKVFAMVEICLNSDLHIGCPQTCVNNIIRSAKSPEKYLELNDTGVTRKDFEEGKKISAEIRKSEETNCC